jgi:two-component system NtrC family sensor kinase
VGVKGNAPSVIRDTRAQKQPQPSTSEAGQELVANVLGAAPVGPTGPPFAPAPSAGSAIPSSPPSSEVRLTRNFEAIGQLAAGVAHEINTPMQYIGDNTVFLGATIRRLLELATSFEQLVGLCRSGQPIAPQVIGECERELNRGRLGFLREQAPTAIEQTLAGIDQVRSIVQALKEFSHPGEEEPVDVDVNRLVEMARTVTRNTWRYVAELKLELCDNPRAVAGYPQELGQVLINLIVNAAHAVEERNAGASKPTLGKITIRTRSTPEHVEIQIADDGQGIPEAIRDRIMAPYFTTKPAGKGTGQGLSLARRIIVDQHGGRLFFESQVGVGTTFYIVLAGVGDAK